VASAVVSEGQAAFPVEPGPLFLHGRDYPSLWCLYWLARLSAEAPLELNTYLVQVTKFAWEFATLLTEYDLNRPLKVTTMFPTSKRNPGSAGQTFQAAAVGGLLRRRDGTRIAVGPLPLWEAASVFEREGTILIAPTQVGLDLLGALEGLSLELPHGSGHAQAFLDHLQQHAPGDFSDFMTVLRIVTTEPNRGELIDEVRSSDVGESQKLADVYAQSYVSRGREWGLVEPRMVAGSYLLTQTGRAIVESN
jgi:hypothetical protein